MELKGGRRGHCWRGMSSVLIVPFMELKGDRVRVSWTELLVLIVPFMELKVTKKLNDGTMTICLNRTFYGIERRKACRALQQKQSVLIVPFMELKGRSATPQRWAATGLNRTFYGIERGRRGGRRSTCCVLIVPFMELKLLLKLR